MSEIKDPTLKSIFANVLINRCHIKAQYSINKEHLEKGAIDLEEYAKRQVYVGIANELQKYPDEINKEEVNNEIVYSKNLYVFPPKYFKEVLEQFVKTLSEQQIKEIKNS